MRGRGESAIDVTYIMMHSITYLSACSFNVVHGFSSSLQRHTDVSSLVMSLDGKEQRVHQRRK